MVKNDKRMGTHQNTFSFIIYSSIICITCSEIVYRHRDIRNEMGEMVWGLQQYDRLILLRGKYTHLLDV